MTPQRIGDGVVRYALGVRADHYQFYVTDVTTEPLIIGTAWDDATLPARLAVGSGFIAVGTARYGGVVDVALEIRRDAPSPDFETFDHVVAASAEFPSGRLQLDVYTPSGGVEPRTIALSPGTYRVLARYSGLDAIAPEDVDRSREQGPDRYEIVLWPGPPTGLTVLKQWPPALTRFT